jgi:hypothetical protein
VSTFSRRQFLGGAGAAIALPFLESLLPRRARAQAVTAPRRLFVFYVPCGIVMDQWTPAVEGTGWAPSPILTPLAPYRDRTLVLTGLANKPARPDGAGDHAAGTGSFLSCVHVKKTEAENISNGRTLDQVAAAALGEGLRFPSLELGIDGGSAAGGCDSGYSCAYARNIAWADATTPLPKTTNPRVVFDRLFAGFDPDATAAEMARRRRYRASILDLSRRQASDLKAKLGRTDQAKLDQYLTAIREVESRLDSAAALCVPGAPPADGLDYPAQVRAMLDLSALAFQCDQTRVITFMIGNAGSGRAHPHLGITEAHHELSHHMGVEATLAKLTQIDTWEIEQLAYLAGRLDGITDVDGKPLLDNSRLYFSSEIEDGNTHSHLNMPIAIVGGSGGALDSGRHVRFTGDPPVANLYLSFLTALGVTAPATFGDDGTGPLPGVLR